LQRADCLLLPQIGNNQPCRKPWSHSWKMFAVWPACNGADGISDIEGKVTRVGASECGQRASFNRDQGAEADDCDFTLVDRHGTNFSSALTIYRFNGSRGDSPYSSSAWYRCPLSQRVRRC
jgi:hypothetical protein